jgi:hypothetical protein
MTTLIFPHIQKTGGTSIRSHLIDLFSPDETLIIYPNSTGVLMEEALSKSEEELSKYKFVCGHFPLGIHEHLPQECKYVTVLRDPVARMVSNYFHSYRTSHFRPRDTLTSLEEEIGFGGLSFKDFALGKSTGSYFYPSLTAVQPANVMFEWVGGGNDPIDMIREHFVAVGVTNDLGNIPHLNAAPQEGNHLQISTEDLDVARLAANKDTVLYDWLVSSDEGKALNIKMQKFLQKGLIELGIIP